MSDETKIALEAHLSECQLRYKVFEEKLDNLQEQQERINKHTFELRQMMTWFMGASASFAAISILLSIVWVFQRLL
jgi:hypothetical protein|tara:strand:+ start:213 stop:440 length:228 start_codon:yes stop_codon:yes gene_type:complete